MNSVIESLDKADILLDSLMLDYGVIDAQNPTNDERTKYLMDCGKIHSLISLISDCVTAANRNLREGIANG